MSFIPDAVRNIVQDRTLERMFHDPMFPKLMYRGEATADLWPANLGDNQTFTRASAVSTKTKPTNGVDPSPSTINYEQWSVTADQYSDSVDTPMYVSTMALANLWMRDATSLGLGAARSMNAVVRNKLFNAYEGGRTVIDGTQTSTTIRVKKLAGFTRKMVLGVPTAVSPTNMLTVYLLHSASVVTYYVTGFTPDVAGDEIGPGTLTFSGTVTSTDRDPLWAITAPYLINAASSKSIDGITSSSALAFLHISAAVARLDNMSVPRFADGKYHCHIDPEAVTQLQNDGIMKSLHTALPDSSPYRDQYVGTMANCHIFQNSESPRSDNVSSATYDAGDYAGETSNAAGVPIRRAIVIGADGIQEKYLDDEKMISAGGINGKIGEFNIINNGIYVMCDRICYIIRAPMDKLQQQVSQSYKFTGGWGIPTDSLTGDNSYFKRAVVIQHCGLGY